MFSSKAELCAKMLAFEATERPSAEEALKHVPFCENEKNEVLENERTFFATLERTLQKGPFHTQCRFFTSFFPKGH